MSAGVSECLLLLRLLSKITGKRSIESFGVFRVLPNHLRIVKPKQANAPSLYRDRIYP